MQENKVYKESAADPSIRPVDEVKSFTAREAGADFVPAEDNEPSSKKKLNKTTKKKIGNLSLGTLAVAVSAAVVTLLIPFVGAPKVESATYEYGYDRFAYELKISSEKESKVTLRIKNDAYSEERELKLDKDITVDSGVFEKLKPETVYLFEVVYSEGIGSSALVKEQFKTAKDPTPPKIPDSEIIDATTSEFAYTRDSASGRIIWSITLTDPHGVLSGFTAKLKDRNGVAIRDVSVANALQGAQSFDFEGLTTGLYYLEIEADTVYPADLANGIARKTIYIGYMLI